MGKPDIDKMTPKEFYDFQMKSPENNMVNCKDVLNIHPNFAYSNYLLSLKPNEKPMPKQEYLNKGR